MNSITLVGYINHLEVKKDKDNENLFSVKFSLCDNQKDNCMWFNCFMKTSKETTVEYIKKKKENKGQFTVVGSMFYNYNADNEKTYINVSIINLS